MSDALKIPENVVNGLCAIRESGITNMFDRVTVTRLLSDIDSDAGWWLLEHKDQYISILDKAVSGETWLID